MTNQNPPLRILATSFDGGPRPRNAAMVLGGLWLILFFAALFSPSLLDDADATHAQAARAMATTGDLVTLHVDGVRYLEKAPLPYWLVAVSYRIFGFNTFATHLPQAIAVLLLALLGYRWANQTFGARTGFYTALSLLTSAGVFLFTRIFIPEVLLSLFLAVALFAFLKTLTPLSSNAAPRFYPYAMWASLACAVLTKGLVALVFFFGTALIFLFLTAELRRWRLLRPLTGGLLFLAIAAPWHVLAALRNTGGENGHGFLWFYFVNEHFLRFLGRRIPADYNRLPGYLYWSLHGVWLFPWALFGPLAIAAIARRFRHQTAVLTGHIARTQFLIFLVAGSLSGILGHGDTAEYAFVFLAVAIPLEIFLRRRAARLPASPFHHLDSQQRLVLLLSLFAALVLLFFSLSTNQEYYTFPAYLPILLLLSATITHAEQTYTENPAGARWITFAHAAFTTVGAIVSIALVYGLWTSRHLPYVPDIGSLLAHRGVGDYTLSMSHLFDLTGPSFAALRLPAILAALAFALGPALAWMLRIQRRHIAATTAVAITSAIFLIAAHIAFVRFAPMLSSQDLASKIHSLRAAGAIAPDTEILIFGDQAFGSSIPFYLGQPVKLVDGRSTSLLFGSTFPDAPPIFVTSRDLYAQWSLGARKILFVPLEQRDTVDRLLGNRQIVLAETSGKALITDRPLPASSNPQPSLAPRQPNRP